MKFLILFSVNNNNNFTNLSSAQLVVKIERVVKIKSGAANGRLVKCFVI